MLNPPNIFVISFDVGMMPAPKDPEDTGTIRELFGKKPFFFSFDQKIYCSVYAII
jgi:hypothetical protein